FTFRLKQFFLVRDRPATAALQNPAMPSASSVAFAAPAAGSGWAAGLRGAARAAAAHATQPEGARRRGRRRLALAARLCGPGRRVRGRRQEASPRLAPRAARSDGRGGGSARGRRRGGRGAAFDPAKAIGVTAPPGRFDPLGFCQVGDYEGFHKLRSSELKRGRGAMMAALGTAFQHSVKLSGFEGTPVGLGALIDSLACSGSPALSSPSPRSRRPCAGRTTTCPRSWAISGTQATVSGSSAPSAAAAAMRSEQGDQQRPHGDVLDRGHRGGRARHWQGRYPAILPRVTCARGYDRCSSSGCSGGARSWRQTPAGAPDAFSRPLRGLRPHSFAPPSFLGAPSLPSLLATFKACFRSAPCSRRKQSLSRRPSDSAQHRAPRSPLIGPSPRSKGSVPTASPPSS
ncbi:unnamed protein product, partial [Prorocentrum cordatum]